MSQLEREERRLALLEDILAELEELNAGMAACESCDAGDTAEPDDTEPPESVDTPEPEEVENPTCGYNGCGRSVSNPEDRCWQHPQED